MLTPEAQTAIKSVADLLRSVVLIGGVSVGVCVGFWNLVGAPYAQSFINDTVEERIGALEDNQDELKRKQNLIIDQMRVLQNTAEGSQDAQSEILRILQLGIMPAPVIIMPNTDRGPR